MIPFTKIEFRATVLILLTIFLVTFKNLKISERKARDFQRRDDLTQIFNALHRFHDDFGFFPPSQDGKILACKGERFNEALRGVDIKDESKRLEVYLANLVPCEWGQDALRDLSDDNYLPYIKVLPSDNFKGGKYAYYYLSNKRVFQLYAYLEGGSSEIGFKEKILDRGLPCGGSFCNYGRSAFGKTPLDMTLEEYEKELREHPEIDKKLESERVN